MAVAAAYFALRHFGAYCVNRVSIHNGLGYAKPLRPNVVELQRSDIREATVNAWVICKVCKDKRPSRSYAASPIKLDRYQVRLLSWPMMISSMVSITAFLASGLEAVLLGNILAERHLGLVRAAVCASFHMHNVLTRSVPYAWHLSVRRALVPRDGLEPPSLCPRAQRPAQLDERGSLVQAEGVEPSVSRLKGECYSTDQLRLHSTTWLGRLDSNQEERLCVFTESKSAALPIWLHPNMMVPAP